jgi:hypothetical protein
VKSFLLNDEQFWFYHGYGLTFLWIVFATFGIAIRGLKNKYTKWTHILIFVLIDYITLFLGGGVIYKYWGDLLSNFKNWSVLTQIHAILGVLFVGVVMVQHVVGVAVHHYGKYKKYHVQQGYILHFLVGALVILGWAIHYNLKLAAATVFFYLMGQKITNFIRTKKTRKI